MNMPHHGNDKWCHTCLEILKGTGERGLAGLGIDRRMVVITVGQGELVSRQRNNSLVLAISVTRGRYVQVDLRMLDKPMARRFFPP